MGVRSKRACQLELHLPTWGGRRKGAGRKRTSERPSPPHRVRLAVRGWAPLLVTLRLRPGLPSLREPETWAVVVRVMRAFRDRFEVSIVHYGVMGNHLHLLVEGRDRESFARGMKALCVRLAKQLNAHFGTKGSLFASRYHARELPTSTAGTARWTPPIATPITARRRRDRGCSASAGAGTAC